MYELNKQHLMDVSGGGILDWINPVEIYNDIQEAYYDCKEFCESGRLSDFCNGVVDGFISTVSDVFNTIF